MLSAEQFEIIGSPEVNQVIHHVRLMRWIRPQNSTSFQENMKVEDFPYDEYEETTQLVTAADTHCNRHWGYQVWKLALATEVG